MTNNRRLDLVSFFQNLTMSDSYVRPSTSTNSFFYYLSISSNFVIDLFIHLPQQISLALALDISLLH